MTASRLPTGAAVRVEGVGGPALLISFDSDLAPEFGEALPCDREADAEQKSEDDGREGMPEKSAGLLLA
jgi:hypothetical protein